MKKSLFYLLFSVAIFSPAESFSQSQYPTPDQVGDHLQAIVKKHPSLATIQSLTKTPSSNDVWLVTLGSGDVANHPATAVIAGVKAQHLVGTETAIRLVDSILSREDAAELLSENTFYIVPSLNPDATEGYFAKLQNESYRTKSLYDNDRDGLMSEDSVEDLDDNGMITAMIVESENGEYIKHPLDSRVVIKADAAKGEKGKYLLFSEGIDNDKDGLLNEDGQDGVDLNRNFTYKYKNWGVESGHYPISEVENRALLDFMYDAFNIHTVISFGPNDNLYSPTTYTNKTRKGVDVDHKTVADTAPKGGNGADIAAMLKTDNILASKVSEIYRANDATANDILAEKPLDGNFTEWAYYHYGRNSFETNVWSVDSEDERGSREVAYLMWADKNGIEDSAVAWSEVEHPDFKGKTVEVGSLAPYALYTPKLELIESQVDATIKTVVDIAELHPEVKLTVESEQLSKGVYRVSAKVANVGEMPTATSIGVQSYFVKYVRVELKLDGQNILQGLRLSTIPNLNAGEVSEFSWIIEGKGKFDIEAGSPQSGYVAETVTL
ncbi:MAG: M14 family metallopeptidase [Rikenellaceae bacterium]